VPAISTSADAQLQVLYKKCSPNMYQKWISHDVILLCL